MQIAGKEVRLKEDFLAKDVRIFGNLEEKRQKGEISDTDFSFEMMYLLVDEVDGNKDKDFIKKFIDNLSLADFNALADAVAKQVQAIQ